MRAYSVAGRPLVDGFEVDQRATDGRGQVLAPWPNRLTAGRYVFDGREVQAPLNEPARSGSIHGLVRWLDWTALAHETSTVLLGCVLHPQPGYEWQLELQVGYRLAEDGLTVSVRVVNPGPGDAPFGIGFHPYLTLGVPVDLLQLRLPARSILSATDPDIPPVPVEVAGTPMDFSTGREVGAIRLDAAFGDLDRQAGGRAVARLSGPDGRSVELWVDEAFDYLMVYTGDNVGAPQRRRSAVAVEPMTCPPDALRSGTGLVRLKPGAEWSASWGIRPGTTPAPGRR